MHLLRSVCVLFFVLFVAGNSFAQQAPAPKKQEEKAKEEKPKPTDEKESFGDYVQKVGEGIWGRVKERFNLEETIANLEEKKNKLLGDKEKKEEPKDVKPKQDTPKTEVPKPDKKAGS